MIKGILWGVFLRRRISAMKRERYMAIELIVIPFWEFLHYSVLQIQHPLGQRLAETNRKLALHVAIPYRQNGNIVPSVG